MNPPSNSPSVCQIHPSTKGQNVVPLLPLSSDRSLLAIRQRRQAGRTPHASRVSEQRVKRRASVWSAWSLLPLSSARSRLASRQRRQAGRTPHASRGPCPPVFSGRLQILAARQDSDGLLNAEHGGKKGAGSVRFRSLPGGQNRVAPAAVCLRVLGISVVEPYACR